MNYPQGDGKGHEDHGQGNGYGHEHHGEDGTGDGGQTTTTVRVPILADSIDEAAETFVLNILKATGADIAVGTGTVTILDEDAPPLSVNLLAGVHDLNGDRVWAQELGPLTRPDGRPVAYTVVGNTLVLDRRL